MELTDDDKTVERTATIAVDLSDLEAPPEKPAPEGNPLLHTPYRMVQKLGEGGMGEVFEALEGASGKTVVIKVLHAAFACSPDFTDRMRIEADVLRSLRHPNLVAVHAFERTPDGRPYLVMEHLRGRTLKDELKTRGVVPVPEAIDFIRQALAGLGAAHALGIVHRDVKPDNLFVCQPAEGRQVVKVLDFGVAKVLGNGQNRRAPAPLSLPTAHGMLIGTPRYAAPEQLRGGPVDARTDVYAAGLVLYTILAGRGPFERLRGASLLRAHLDQEPEPPSMHAPRPVPRELDRVVLRALSKSPDDRYDSARAFAEALCEVADGYDTPLRAGAFRNGDVCGGYRIEQLLALGQISEIYAAVHEYTNRQVALKCLQAERTTNADLCRAMRTEAMLMARVDSRHVVRLCDAGTAPGGMIFTAMERLRGRTLRQVLSDVPRVPARNALHLAAQIAAGLEALHRAGAVHGDVRPENIFVTDEGEIKVLDLGAALPLPTAAATSALDAGAPGRKGRVRSRPQGLPAYLAPEQLVLDTYDRRAPDARSDVYAVGHIAYEMLLGRHAFARRKHQWPSCGELVLMQQGKEPIPLPQLLPDFPPIVWNTLKAAFAKDPNLRPTMAALRTALEVAARACTEGVGAGFFRRIGLWVRRAAAFLRAILEDGNPLAPAKTERRGDAIHLLR